MLGSITDWVASKIEPPEAVVGRTSEGLLLVEFEGSGPFPVGVIGVKDVVLPEHVQPLLSYATKPQFIVNIPSKTPWSGEAISLVHAAPAAFGTLGEIQKAAKSGNVPAYRNKNWAFFERAIRQHTNVRAVTRIYDEVFEADLISGGSLRIALIEGYHVSAEDVRNAKDRFEEFDIAVKKTNYGSITDEAKEAAASMGAEVLDFRGLMRKLAW